MREGPSFRQLIGEVSSASETRVANIIPLRRSQASDADLVDAVARGDERALAQVWERYVREVRVSIKSSLGRDPAVDDLVQEVFLAFYRGASRMQNPRSLRAYLLGAAMRLTAFEIRTRRRRFRRLRLTPRGSLPEI